MNTFLKRIGILMTIILEFLSTYAYDFEYEGLFYNIVSTGDLTCSLVEDNVPYNGNLVIPDKVVFNGKELNVVKIGCSLSDVSSITFNNYIEEIPNNCFLNNQYIKSVKIPINITKIGSHSFSNCLNLNNVSIEGSPKILEEAFSNCKNLAKFSWSSEMKLSKGIFKNCYNLKELNFPSISLNIPEEAFYNCSQLSVDVSEVQSFGESSFEGCKSLDVIELLSVLNLSKKNIFKDCGKIKIVKIGKQLNEINKQLWNGCVIDSLFIEDSEKEIIIYNNEEKANYHFSSYGSSDVYYYYAPYFYNIPIYSLYLGRNIKDSSYSKGGVSTDHNYYPMPFSHNKGLTNATIGIMVDNLPSESGAIAKDTFGTYGFFSDCINLTSCIFAKEPQIELGSYCFKNTLIKSLTLPQKNIIRDNAFTYSSIESIEFGYDVTFLGQAFNISLYYGFDTPYSSKIKKIKLNSKTPPSYDFELWWQYSPTTKYLPPFDTPQYLEIKLYVPYGCLKNYQEAEPWRNFWNIEEMPGIDAEKIILNFGSSELIVGETVQLEATVVPEDATDKTIIWNSSNEEIASVSEDGLVTAHSEGTSIITATCGEVSSECVITVLNNAGVESLLSNPETSISVYSIEGILIKKDCKTNELKYLSKGIYIIVSGKERYKISI